MLLKDINPGPADSSPQDFTNVNGVIFFTADDGTNGRELWKTDGTTAGTTLVKAINPGPGSDPQDLTKVNGTLFFDATDGINGRELWKSDGTAAGTVLVKAIYPGHGSDPGNLTNVNGTLFFDADDGVHGDELWKSDGTAAGTVLVKDINPGPNSSDSYGFLNMNGTLFFAANDGTHGWELWKSDGTDAGTVLVKDINPGPADSDPYELTNVNGTLFFAANDGTTAHGIELWKSDGTEAGTVLVKDIYPGPRSSYPAGLTNVNGTLFFAAEDNISGYELWKSDGTEAGTVLVKDINPGPADSNPDQLTNVNGTLFFQADDGTHGVELWKSDGTAAGTVLVKDINPGPADSNPDWLTNVSGTLFFAADDGTNGVELWQSDGTAAGTFLVQKIHSRSAGSNPTDLAYANGRLYFAAADGVHGIEPWVLVAPSVVTHFNVSTPASSTAGVPFTVTVTALDQFNNVVTGYTGTVHFTSSDLQATLPADYTFTTADNGMHTFSGGVTLKTAGPQTVTATDTANNSITGTATVTVNPAAASQFLVYTDAASPDVAGTVFDVVVVAVDPYGNIDTNYHGTVHFSSGDPYGATLPADYTFQASDQGQVILFGMTALYTASTWDVTATDTVNGSITGSAFVTVIAAPAVSLAILAPPSVTSGTPFDVTVVALDPYGNIDGNYGGTITWTTTDPGPGVVLPADYAFQPSDQGVAYFLGGVTLITPGVQTLTVTDTVNTSITGNTPVTVNPPGSGPHRNNRPELGTGIPLPTVWPRLLVVPTPPIETTPVEAAPSRNVALLDRLFMAAQGEDQSLTSPHLRPRVLARADEGFWIFFRNNSILSDKGFPTLPWD
jgi:ELWxxDGT repeat protein